MVDAFVEKPSMEVAKEYLESGDYLWNSGMFLFKASRYLEELKKHRPDIYEACQLSMEGTSRAVSYTHLRAHETLMNLVCRLLLEKTRARGSMADAPLD